MKKFWKRAAAILTAAALLLSGGADSTGIKAVTEAADETFQILNQSEMVAAMGAGWNLGNQLEAANSGTPNETNWGNPVITEDLILAVKDAGFNSIRIPVSYLSMIGSAPNYTINSSWLDRVQEVVDMCVDNGLYAIINIHGDGYYSVEGGWLLCGESEQTEIKAKYEACWKQIANRFKDYDEHLVFESMNEEFDGNYGTPDQTAYQNINDYNQIFVDTVRQSGGNNDKRWLLIPGWNTNIDYTAGNYGFALPTDTYLSDEIPSGQKRIMISVHYYDPWDFCGEESGTVTQWGDTVTDSSKTASWGDESYLQSQFKKMADTFGSKGYPVVIGEYGSIDKSDFDSSNAANRAEFARKVCYFADMYGLVPVYWDNGYNGQYGFGLFDRSSYKVTQQGIIDAIMETYGSDEEATATDISLSSEELTLEAGADEVQLTATLTPTDSQDKITWKSSNDDVAAVNARGVVTPIAPGNCTITATIPAGVSAECKVTVTQPTKIRAGLYLQDTQSWTTHRSTDYAEISSEGGNYTLSINGLPTGYLQHIASLYIKDIAFENSEAVSPVFTSATIKFTEVTVNGKSYTFNKDTFKYAPELNEGGLATQGFDFALINVWGSTYINDVTVEADNYLAYFNEVSYQDTNTLSVSFTVSDVKSVTASPATTPGTDVTPTPGADATPTPGADATPTPGADATSTPGADATPTPGADATPTPGADATPTPGADATPTPGADATPTPGADATPTPGTDATPTPGADVTPTPGSNTDDESDQKDASTSNPVKKISAKKKVVLKKGKKKKVVVNVVSQNNKKKTTDKVKVTVSKKKNLKMLKQTMKVKKLVLKVKAVKKGKTVLKVKIGKKTCRIKVICR